MTASIITLKTLLEEKICENFAFLDEMFSKYTSCIQLPNQSFVEIYKIAFNNKELGSMVTLCEGQMYPPLS